MEFFTNPWFYLALVVVAGLAVGVTLLIAKLMKKPNGVGGVPPTEADGGVTITPPVALSAPASNTNVNVFVRNGLWIGGALLLVATIAILAWFFLRPQYDTVTMNVSAPTKVVLRTFAKYVEDPALSLSDDQVRGQPTLQIPIETDKVVMVNAEVNMGPGTVTGWATDDGNTLMVQIPESGKSIRLTAADLSSFNNWQGQASRIYAFKIGRDGVPQHINSR